MSDDVDFDPNAGVPLWVNVIVPIVSGLVFIAVLVLLFHTKKEVAIETIEDWVEKIPFVNRCISIDYETQETGAKASSMQGKNTKDTRSSLKRSQVNERSKIRKSSSYNDIRRYDSISTIRTNDNSMLSGDLQGPSRKQYYYASQGTLVSFESSV